MSKSWFEKASNQNALINGIFALFAAIISAIIIAVITISSQKEDLIKYQYDENKKIQSLLSKASIQINSLNLQLENQIKLYYKLSINLDFTEAERNYFRDLYNETIMMKERQRNLNESLTKLRTNADSLIKKLEKQLTERKIEYYTVFEDRDHFKNMYYMVEKNFSQLKDKYAALEKKIKSSDNDAKLYYENGRNNEKLGNHRKAIDEYKKASQIDSTDANIFYNIAWNYEKLGKHKSAVTYYTKTIKLNPQYAIAYYSRAWNNEKLGNSNQVLADYSKAIELNKDYASAYFNRGYYYEQLSRFREAVVDYSKTIELIPDYIEAYSHRASINNKLGYKDESTQDLLKADSLRKNISYSK